MTQQGGIGQFVGNVFLALFLNIINCLQHRLGGMSFKVLIIWKFSK